MCAPEESLSNTNSTPRVKVFRSNEYRKWEDRGIGHVTVDYLEGSEYLVLHVIDEEDNKTLLVHKVSPDDIYRRQEDTIISWKDPEYSVDWALSFQEIAGCSYIWDQICAMQTNMHFKSLNNGSEVRKEPEVPEEPEETQQDAQRGC